MEIKVEVVKQLFNPNKTINDFPLTVEAVFPDPQPIADYDISRDGQLVNIDSGRVNVIVKAEDRSARVAFVYRDEDGNTVGGHCTLKEVMVLSYFVGHYSADATLITVINHDRYQSHNSIHNLVPIFTTRQLQGYFIWRLEDMAKDITGEKFRVAASKYPDEYSLDKYLVGNGGTVFALDTKVFMSSGKGRYMSFYTYPTFKQEEHGADARCIQGHILVAATFVGDIPPKFHVHHQDGHPRNNTASNLRILSPEDHRKLHSSTFFESKYKTDINKTCSVCLKEDKKLNWLCPCKKAFCPGHAEIHKKDCWYFEHDNDPEYNKYVPLIQDGKVMINYEINQKAEIRHVNGGKVRSTTSTEHGYSTIKVSKTTPTRVVHLLMASTFFGHEMKPGMVVDHIDGNRMLNHLHNLRPCTQQQNTVYAHGVTVVVKYKETEATATFQSIDQCAGVFSHTYPTIRAQLHKADSVVDTASHIFYRDPKRRVTHDKFYLD